MEVKIQLAEKGQSKECLDCIRESELWDVYFASNAIVQEKIEEMIGRKQIYIASNPEHKCIGFIGVIHNGCFKNFSYLSLIAVDSAFRNKGIGSQLLRKYEELGFQQADKVFLLVSDFNHRAQEFYKRSGYTKVGEIPELYKKGVSEQILIKYKM